MENVFRWGQPDAFFLLLFIAGLVVFYIYFENKQQLLLAQKFGRKVSDFLSQSVSYPRRRLIFGLQCVSLMLFVLALARPQAGQSQQEIRNEGIELIILADVSESMLAEDVRPSRLTQMKIELGRMIDLMPGNKTGIIAFAGSAALLSPLTSDPSALKMYIESLDVDSVSSQGTHFQTALTYAEEAFERGGVTQDVQSKTTRAIIVASDGEDHEEGALQIAKRLAEKGIHIYTIAYGTEKGGGIPVRDRFGQMTGYKKDNSGQPILTQVKGQFLQQLAEAGQGEFYFGVFNGDHLKSLSAAIGQLQKSQFKSELTTQYEEQFYWPLSLGMILMALSLLLSDAVKEKKPWKGRYENA